VNEFPKIKIEKTEFGKNKTDFRGPYKCPSCACKENEVTIVHKCVFVHQRPEKTHFNRRVMNYK